VTLSHRDKLTAILGAVAAGGILLVVFVIIPAIRQWQAKGFQLARKQNQVARLDERLKERDSLVAERDRLSAIIGSVLGPEAYPPPKEEEEPKDKKPEDKEAGAQEKDKKDAAAQEEAGPKPPQPDVKGAEAKDSQVKTQPEKGAGETASAEKPGELNASRNSDTAQPARPPADPEQVSKPSENKKAQDKNKETPAPKGVSFIAHIERTAKKSGVNLKRLSRGRAVRSAKKVPRFTAVGLHLSFDTQVKQLTKFLYALENGDRLARIERSDIRRDLKKPNNIQVTLNVVGYELATGK